MSKKELIIFDFFGVISSEIAPIWLRKYFDEETSKTIKRDIVSQVDIGEISEEELYIKLGDLAKLTPEKVKNEWEKLVIINTELTDFIRSIKNNYLIALLSNASETFLRKILDKYSLYDLFDTIVISSEEKIVKPNEEIYNIVLNRLDIKPEKALMIDDNITNINGSKEAGIEGIIYNDFKKFKKEFEIKTKAS